MKDITALKNKYKGERCFILGNGPSLKQHDLSLLKDEFIFFTNWFPLHDIYKDLKNPFWCVRDCRFWEYGKGFVENFIETSLNNSATISFFEVTARPLLDRREDFSHRNVYYLDHDEDLKAYEGDIVLDVTQKVHWGLTVIIDFCFPLAHYMGFSDFYLLGCDCDYQLNKDHNFNQSYFYQIDETPNVDQAYIKQHRDENQAHFQHEKWFKGYENLNQIFTQDSKKIYNAGIGGMLEVFPRVDYKTLF